LGEERASIAGSSEIGWVIDPIDGTVNFLYDLPVVAVSIAATLNGVVVAGAVADVLRDEVFTARLGHGTRLNGRPVFSNSVTDIGSALIATGFSYSADRRAEEAKVVSRIVPAARDIRCFGSSALHLAWIACGRVDGYWESDINYWDVAAGALLAREAGADVYLESPTGSGCVLAAPPGIFDQLRSLVRT
jgi:myo-inositol-1(or 4)-monophosphatase